MAKKTPDRKAQDSDKRKRESEKTGITSSTLIEIISSLKINNISLLKTELDRRGTIQDDEIDDAELKYGCVAYYSVDEDEDLVGYGGCNARIEKDEDNFIEIKAVFSFVVNNVGNYEKKELELVCIHVGRNMIWQKFLSLYGFISSQILTDMPRLLESPSIDVEQMESEDS